MSFSTLRVLWFYDFVFFLYVYIYIYIFSFIGSNFVVICNKGILRHLGSVTCVYVAESSPTHGWVTLQCHDCDCCRCYQQGLHTVPLLHDTFSGVDLRAIYWWAIITIHIVKLYIHIFLSEKKNCNTKRFVPADSVTQMIAEIRS